MSADTLLSRLHCAPPAGQRPASESLPVSGITPFTTIDYPGRLAAVLYTQGCAWRCRYCHNGHLQSMTVGAARLDWGRIREFLKSRAGLLDAVVFSGGEPTLHESLAAAMTEIKQMGFLVGLHTAGMNPAGLQKVLPLCDWVGMDFKAPISKYESITGVPNSGGKAFQSARLLLASGCAHEFRATLHPDLQSRQDVEEIAAMLSRMGARQFVLQRFRPVGCEDPDLCLSNAGDGLYWDELKQVVSAYFPTVPVRG